METVRSLQQLLHPRVLVENVYLFSVLSIFLGMYGPHLHIRLPLPIQNLFNSSIFRGVVLFLVVFMADRDIGASLTIVIIFLITMNLLHTSGVLENTAETFQNMVKTVNQKTHSVEHFQHGLPVAHCDNYLSNESKSPYYPISSDDKKLLESSTFLKPDVNEITPLESVSQTSKFSTLI